MSRPDEVGKGTVSGNQVSIPAHIRRRFDLQDGDVIEWQVIDGSLDVELRKLRTGAFQDFEPGASDEDVDVVAEHDRHGLD